MWRSTMLLSATKSGPPHRVEDLLARHHAAGIGGEHVQQTLIDPGQVQGLSTHSTCRLRMSISISPILIVETRPLPPPYTRLVITTTRASSSSGENGTVMMSSTP